jgi:hypothetical protein
MQRLLAARTHQWKPETIESQTVPMPSIRGSILLCTGTETPDASRRTGKGMRDNGAEHDQMIVSTDESAQTDRANRDSVAAGEARQVIGGINCASQQERGLGEVAIAKGIST